MSAPPTRRALLLGLAALALGGCVPPAPNVAPTATGPVGSLRLGLVGTFATMLPFQLGSDGLYAAEGLEVQTLTVAPQAVAQALAAGSLDLAAVSPNYLISLRSAGQEIIGLYAGFNQADYGWYARPEITSWAQLRGRTLGVTSLGGATASLTRYVLRKHGLDPETDVTLVPVSVAGGMVAALKAGQVDAGLLGSPLTWQAEAAGFRRLGTQAEEVAASWPKFLLIARERLLDERADALGAFLRAVVRAIRAIKADRSAAVAALVATYKFEPAIAERAYDELAAGYDERGRLPTAAMPTFWKITIEAGEAPEAWPEERLLDRRFVDSFDRWAPR